MATRLGAKYWKAEARSHEEAEIKTIRDKLSRRIREPDHVRSATSKGSKVQDGCEPAVDVHTLRKKLSAKLKRKSSLQVLSRPKL